MDKTNKMVHGKMQTQKSAKHQKLYSTIGKYSSKKGNEAVNNLWLDVLHIKSRTAFLDGMVLKWIKRLSKWALHGLESEE